MGALGLMGMLVPERWDGSMTDHVAYAVAIEEIAAGPAGGVDAKLFAFEMAETVASDAIQVLGGYGYTRDFPVERIWRDVRVCQIHEGTSDVQRMVIAKSLVG